MKENALDVENNCTLCSDVMVNEVVLIHYGTTSYDPSLVEPIRNEWFPKPLGGFWASPVNSKWGWKDWCIREDFMDCVEENSIRLKFKEGSKVILIDSLSDLDKLPIRVGEWCNKGLDYEKISTMADAIWLTEKGERETRWSEPLSLYAWDCESVLIMNPGAVYECVNK